MALDKKDQKIIEQYLGMGSGYVLNYSNRTFEEFFNQFDIEIYDERYNDIGDSKAKRFRSFFNQHDDALIGKVLLEMIEEYDIERDTSPFAHSNHNDALRVRCLAIANKLAHSALTASSPPPQKFNNPFIQRQRQVASAPPQKTGGWNQPTAQIIPTPTQAPTPMHSVQPVAATHEKIFIVHGHDEHLLVETENLCRKLRLDPIILKDQYSGGNTIIEKLEAHSNVKYAIILYTACDEGRKIGTSDLSQRARQNVVFEHGYFIGKLGRGNVAAVVKGHVEIQGDVSGVVYFPYRNGWQFELAKEMKGSGLPVDLNNV